MRKSRRMIWGELVMLLLATMVESGWGGGGGGGQKVGMAEVMHQGSGEAASWKGRKVLQTTSSGGSYCVVSATATSSDEMLQAALDWACGSGSSLGNADCSAILSGGVCFNPDTLQAHASYAFNYYYVKQSASAGSCDFGGLATTTSSDPSSGSCVYPSLSSGIPSISSVTNVTSPGPASSSSLNGAITMGSPSLVHLFLLSLVPLLATCTISRIW